MISRLAVLISLAVAMPGCSYVKQMYRSYKGLPDDNPIEEGVEWSIESAAELLGEDMHLDLSGDSPER